ncbi:MAG: hypothetical protein PCFJNLEI_02078 [Verrucomicrobiae bacterium]|nr:hypothetical protein [Verrucomicrobiae bacterium]
MKKPFPFYRLSFGQRPVSSTVCRVLLVLAWFASIMTTQAANSLYTNTAPGGYNASIWNLAGNPGDTNTAGNGDSVVISGGQVDIQFAYAASNDTIHINSAGILSDNVAFGLSGSTLSLNSGGRLLVGTAGNSLSGAVVRLNGGILQYSLNGIFSPNGALEVWGNSVITNSYASGNSSTYTNRSLDFTVADKTLTVAGSPGGNSVQAHWFNTAMVSNNATLLFSRTPNGVNPTLEANFLNMTLTPAITLTVTNAGTLNLYGSNSGMEGTLDIRGGVILFVRSSGALGTATNLLNNNATLSVGALNNSLGSVVRLNGGNLHLTALNNTVNYAGNLEVWDDSVILKTVGAGGTANFTNSTLDFTRADKALTFALTANGGGDLNLRFQSVMVSNDATTILARTGLGVGDFSVQYNNLAITAGSTLTVTNSTGGNLPLTIMGNNSGMVGGLDLRNGVTVLAGVSNVLGSASVTIGEGARVNASAAYALGTSTNTLNSGGLLTAGNINNVMSGAVVQLNGGVLYYTATPVGGAFSPLAVLQVMSDSTITNANTSNSGPSGIYTNASLDFTGAGTTLKLALNATSGDGTTYAFKQVMVSNNATLLFSATGAGAGAGKLAAVFSNVTLNANKTLTLTNVSASGNSTLSFFGNNTALNGAISVNTGMVLFAGASNSLGSATGTINAGGTLVVTGGVRNALGTSVNTINAGGTMFVTPNPVTSNLNGSVTRLNGGVLYVASTINNPYAPLGDIEVWDDSTITNAAATAIIVSVVHNSLDFPVAGTTLSLAGELGSTSASILNQFNAVTVSNNATLVFAKTGTGSSAGYAALFSNVTLTTGKTLQVTNRTGAGTGTLTFLGNNNGMVGALDVRAGATVVANASNVLGRASLYVNGGTLAYGNIFAGVNDAIAISNGTLFASTAGTSYLAGNGRSNQTVLVTGSSSIFTNVGVFALGTNAAVNNVVTVAKNGTLFATAITVGNSVNAFGNGLVISNGGAVQGGALTIGSNGATGNFYHVLGGGTASNGVLTVGGGGSGFNTLSVSNATLLSGGAVVIGSGSSNNLVTVSNAGRLDLLDNQLTLGIGAARSNQLAVSGGTVVVGNLVVTGVANRVSLGAGTLSASTTVYSNGTDFVIGAGTQTAVFQTRSGNHIFQSNVIVTNGGLLAGTGNMIVNDGAGQTVIQNGGFLSPGSSPGVLTNTGNAEWQGGGSYIWEINSITGPAGSTWDLWEVTGNLDITAASGNEFVIDINSLTAGNTVGNVSDFNADSDYTFTIAAAGSVTGFSADDFILNLAGFSNAYDGIWSLAQSGNSVVLNYTGAVNFVWNNVTGTFSNSSPVGVNWQDAVQPPDFKTNVALYFGGTGSQQYTASNDIDNLVAKRIALTNNSSATQYLIGNGITLSSSVTPQVQQNGAGRFVISNAFALAVNTLFTGTGSGALEVAGPISGNASLTKTGTYALVLSGLNTYSGATTIKQGTVVVAATNALANSTVNNLVTGGLTFSNLTGASLRGLTGTGNVTLQNTAGTGVGLTIGNTGASTVFGGVLSGSGSLTKSGAGSFELTGANTYSGATIVNAGTLSVNNSLASSAVTMNGGTLGGTGSIAGAVSVNNGGHLAPGNTGSTIAIQHMGLLTLNSGSVLDFQFQPNPPGGLNDQIIVDAAGGLTINGGGFNLLTETGTLANNNAQRFTDIGVYNLINYSGVLGGLGISALSVLNPADTSSYAFGDNGSWITLTIGGGGVGWNGSSGAPGNWSDAGNWNEAVSAGSLLVFAVNTTVNNNNDFTPGTWFSGIVFSNTANSFTLNGNPLALAGNVGNFSANSQTINTALILTNGSRIFATSAGNIIVNADISEAGGSYGIVKTGSKTLILNGGNTFTGVTEIQGGALRAAAGVGLPAASNLKLNGGVFESAGPFNRSLGTIAGAVQWTGSGGFSASGGTLTVNLNNNAGGLVWGSTANFLPDGSALRFSSSGANGMVAFLNPINLNGGSRTVDVTRGTTPIVDADLIGALSGTGGSGLVKTGGGVLRLSANNTYGGSTVVNGGTLIVNGALASGALSLSSGASLAGTGTLASVVSGGGTIAPGHSPGILTVNQLDPSGGLDFNFEFTRLDSPDYTQPGASSNDVLRITNATPFTATLGVANTVNLYVTAPLAIGVTNWFRGGFYTDQSVNFDAWILGATYRWFYNSALQGTPALVRTVDETGTQFSGQNGWVMEFGVVGGTMPVAVVPEPNVLVFWLSGSLTFAIARRRKRHAGLAAPTAA